jgi:hypothetical protein
MQLTKTVEPRHSLSRGTVADTAHDDPHFRHRVLAVKTASYAEDRSCQTDGHGPGQGPIERCFEPRLTDCRGPRLASAHVVSTMS